MRKLFAVLLVVSLLFVCGGCVTTTQKEFTENDLTSSDFAKIDIVYNYLSSWDVGEYDSGETHFVNKIAFFDYDSDGNVAFYINFPIAAYRVYGFYIDTSNSKLYTISPQIGYSASVSAGGGTDWNHNASDSQKYEIIKNAYIAYLNK